MITPSLEDLLQRVDSQYTLAIAAAKRARQINAMGHGFSNDCSIRAVSLSLEDILNHQVIIERE